MSRRSSSECNFDSRILIPDEFLKTYFLFCFHLSFLLSFFLLSSFPFLFFVTGLPRAAAAESRGEGKTERRTEGSDDKKKREGGRKRKIDEKKAFENDFADPLCRIGKPKHKNKNGRKQG